MTPLKQWGNSKWRWIRLQCVCYLWRWSAEAGEGTSSIPLWRRGLQWGRWVRSRQCYTWKEFTVLSFKRSRRTLIHRVSVCSSPVQGDSRRGGLGQVIDQRWPAAASRGKWEGLGPVMIHHLQTPVRVNRHSVTYRKKYFIIFFLVHIHDFLGLQMCTSFVYVKVLTFLFLIRSSWAAAVTGLQPMMLSVQITVKTAVDVQMSVTAQTDRNRPFITMFDDNISWKWVQGLKRGARTCPPCWNLLVCCHGVHQVQVPWCCYWMLFLKRAICKSDDTMSPKYQLHLVSSSNTS